MNPIDVKTFGDFLRYYETDLAYIQSFHKFLNGKITKEKFSSKEDGSFYRFLIEFRIIRNIVSGSTERLIDLTKEWCESKKGSEVDKFAEHIHGQGMTHGGIPRSLASKVLFLNNPWKILPMDSLARKALGESSNRYENFSSLLEEFRSKNESRIELLSQYAEPFVQEIENRYKEVKQIKIIRKNRLFDKLLWITGQS